MRKRESSEEREQPARQAALAVPGLRQDLSLRRKTHCSTKKLANLAASILFYLLTKS